MSCIYPAQQNHQPMLTPSHRSVPTVQSPLGTATGFPRKAASKTGEVWPIFPETPLTLPRPLLPELYGPIDPFDSSIWTTKLNSATILDNNQRNYCPTVWGGKILSVQVRTSDLVLALWFNAVLCATFFFMIIPASHYFLEKSAPSQPKYAPVGKAILNGKQFLLLREIIYGFIYLNKTIVLLVEDL